MLGLWFEDIRGRRAWRVYEADKVRGVKDSLGKMRER